MEESANHDMQLLNDDANELMMRQEMEDEVAVV